MQSRAVSAAFIERVRETVVAGERNFVKSKYVAADLGLEGRQHELTRVGMALSALAAEDDPPIRVWRETASTPTVFEVLD